MSGLVEAVTAVWGIGLSIYDRAQTSATEERIQTMENIITIHQFVICLLIAGLVMQFFYIHLRRT